MRLSALKLGRRPLDGALKEHDVAALKTWFGGPLVSLVAAAMLLSAGECVGAVTLGDLLRGNAPRKVSFTYNNNAYEFFTHKTHDDEVLKAISPTIPAPNGYEARQETLGNGTSTISYRLAFQDSGTPAYRTLGQTATDGYHISEATFYFDKDHLLSDFKMFDMSKDLGAIADFNKRVASAPVQPDAGAGKSAGHAYNEVEIKSYLHIQAASNACNWPLTTGQQKNLDSRLLEAQQKVNPTNFKFWQAFASGGVRKMEFCIDDGERKKFDKLIKYYKL